MIVLKFQILVYLHYLQLKIKIKILKTACGTPNYVAPDVLLQQGYDGRLSDVWSAGCILFVMCSGHLPFEDDTMNGLFKKILACDVKYPEYFSKELIKLLSRIFIVDARKRITIPEIIQDSWFKIGYKEVEVINIEKIEYKENIEFQNAEVKEPSSNQKQKKKIELMTAFDLTSSLIFSSIVPFSKNIKKENRFIVSGENQETIDFYLKLLTEMKANPIQKRILLKQLVKIKVF